MVPSYKICLVPERYTTDKNKSFNVIIKVSGAGHINQAKCIAYSDLNVLLVSYGDKEQKGDHIFFDVPSKLFEKREGFSKYSSPALNCEFGPEHNVGRLRVKPLSSGDHVISFVFSYSPDNINWYSDRLEFKFHVNTVMDKFGSTIALTGLISSIIFREQLYNLILNSRELINRINLALSSWFKF